MRKRVLYTVITVGIIAILSSYAVITSDTWANLASNQTVSRAALENGIKSGALAATNTAVPADSERNITAGEVINYIYLDPNNAGYKLRSSVQLVQKSDITPLNDSVSFYSNSGTLTSAASACFFKTSGTSFKIHYASPLAVGSYIITVPYQGDTRPQYFYNSVNDSVYMWNASSDIGSVTGCAALELYIWVHYSGNYIYVDCRTGSNGGGALTSVSCSDTITVNWTSTDFPSGTSGTIILPSGTTTVSSKLDPGGAIDSLGLTSHVMQVCGNNWFIIQKE